MKLKTGTFSAMAKDIIQNDNKIIIFGMGVIGTTVTPEILNSYHLLERVQYCVDNDSLKWNTYIELCGKKTEIKSPKVLEGLGKRITVLIAMSRWANAYRQLLAMNCTEQMDCYFIPEMCIRNYNMHKKTEIFKDTDNPIIPKKIHYMWFGEKPLPDRLKRCIDSWYKVCPDYEIIQWNESNYDVHKNRFVSEAYDNKKYGFIPDYARLDVLYRIGGIYMDTDVELRKTLDDLLYQKAFVGVEKWQVLNFGGCSGSVKGNSILKQFMDEWEKRSLIRADGSLDNISSGLIDTGVALRNGYVINGETQNMQGMNVYSSDFFHPYDYFSGKTEITENTRSIHHFDGGWVDSEIKEIQVIAEKQYETLLESMCVVLD